MSERLEQKFAETEKARKQVAEKVKLFQTGAPSVSQGALHDVQELKHVLSDLLEARAFQRIAKVLEMVQSHVEVSAELARFSGEINDLNGKLQRIMEIVEIANTSLEMLHQKISVDLDERRKLRQKQLATLNKLDQYLKDWL